MTMSPRAHTNRARALLMIAHLLVQLRSWAYTSAKKHKNSAKSFSYNARFTVCLNNGDSHRILQADNDGVLFFLSYTFEIFGNAVTVNRIGPLSSEKKFCYEIKAKTQGSVLSLQSIAKEIQGWSKVPPSKGSLLIPNEYFGSSAQTILEIRIWPAH